MTRNIPIRIERILDFYDVPQLFIARDAFETLYLCLLYTDEQECRYTAIRISGKRIEEFLSGKTDLRELFLSPETGAEYFDVTLANNEYQITSSVPAPLSEDRLPEKGYTACTSEENENENVIINIPVSDRYLLKEIVRRFGWACM